MPDRILVYADWVGLNGPVLLGHLHVSGTRGGGERFEFEYAPGALASPDLQVRLDPRIVLFAGRQHPPQGNNTFGMFADASPDRWGKLLMRRRFEREVRAGRVPAGRNLHESDYLLGVHDR